MEIKDLRSTLVALYAVDEYDFKALASDAFAVEVKRVFGCAKVENPLQLPMQIIAFGTSQIKIEGASRVLDRIILEERKITIGIGGTSQEARMVLKELLKLIQSFETRHEVRDISAILEVDETVCLAKLDFMFPKLLAGSAGSNLFDSIAATPNLAPQGVTINAYPTSIRYKISYGGENETLRRNHIALNEKVLTIEVREGSDPRDCVFFAAAPIKSDELLEFLSALEKQMK